MSNIQTKVKRGTIETTGDYYFRDFYTSATRNIHGQPNTWPVYDKRTNPEWYDDCVAEFDTVKEAKEYMLAQYK